LTITYNPVQPHDGSTNVCPPIGTRSDSTDGNSSGTIIQLQSENEDLRRKHQELTETCKKVISEIKVFTEELGVEFFSGLLFGVEQGLRNGRDQI